MRPHVNSSCRCANGATSALAIFNEQILPLNQPARAARRGRATGRRCAPASNRRRRIVDYLRGFDTGSVGRARCTATHRSAVASSTTSDLTGLNFERRTHAAGRIARRELLAIVDESHTAGDVRPGALPDRRRALPDFARDNALGILAESIVPRVCGSAIVSRCRPTTTCQQPRLRGRRTAALHAVPARAGREPVRRPAGIHARRPAHQHGAARCVPTTNVIPRFRDALAHAQVAELEPGDALFIPYMWWHHVETLVALQRAGELLVGRPAAVERLAIRSAGPRPDVGAFAAAATPRDLAHDVRSLRFRDRRRIRRRICRRAARHPGSASTAAAAAACAATCSRSSAAPIAIRADPRAAQRRSENDPSLRRAPLSRASTE